MGYSTTHMSHVLRNAQVQNRKLGERLRERNRFHVELERKVELLTDKHENDSR